MKIRSFVLSAAITFIGGSQLGFAETPKPLEELAPISCTRTEQDECKKFSFLKNVTDGFLAHLKDDKNVPYDGSAPVNFKASDVTRLISLLLASADTSTEHLFNNETVCQEFFGEMLTSVKSAANPGFDIPDSIVQTFCTSKYFTSRALGATQSVFHHFLPGTVLGGITAVVLARCGKLSKLAYTGAGLAVLVASIPLQYYLWGQTPTKPANMSQNASDAKAAVAGENAEL